MKTARSAVRYRCPSCGRAVIDIAEGLQGPFPTARTLLGLSRAGSRWSPPTNPDRDADKTSITFPCPGKRCSYARAITYERLAERIRRDLRAGVTTVSLDEV